MKVSIAVTAGPAKGNVFTFDQPDCFLFGRTKDARVSLPDDPYVSRQHFILEIAPPNCRISDLDSKNGTFVNGTRYGGRKAPEPGTKTAPEGITETRIKNGDEIVVGDTKMKVTLVADKADSEPCADMPDEIELALTLRHTERESPIPAQVTLLDTSPGRPGAPHRPHRKGFEENLTVADSLPNQNTGARQPTVDRRTVNQNTVQESSNGQGTIIEQASIRNTLREKGANLSVGGSVPAGEVADLLELDDAPIIPGFRIEDILGQGGMGRVYKGIDLRSGHAVAIKALIPQVAVSFNNFRAFHREIELTSQLDHPNIVQFLGLGKVKGAFYCVLEFVKGMDLRAYVKSTGGKLPFDEAMPIMLATLDGLSYAHRKQVTVQAVGRTNVFRGIVHRDIKPENILLGISAGPGGKNIIVPKVADFGLSKSFESAGMTDMTMSGVAGTPAYWPREQITHYRYLHPSTDVFSIAAVFYEIMTGATARPGLKKRLDECRRCNRVPQIADYIRVISENPMQPIRALNPAIPSRVADVIDRALRETEVPVDEIQMRKALSELRYKDAGAFRDALVVALK